MQEKPLIDYLDNITKDELVNKMRIAGLKHTGLVKRAIVAILEEFSQDEQNIGKIWNSLSPFEKEYLDEFLKYEERPGYQKLKDLYQKHDVQESNSRDRWEEKSNMRFFFIGASVPPQTKRLLTRYLTPIVINYNTLEQPPEDENNRINIIGESFAEDFCSVIKLANSTNLALTKEKQVPAKSAVVKINNTLKNKDFVFEYIGQIAGIRSIENTNRIYGIYMLLVESNLLYESNNSIKFSNNAVTFLSLNLADKCKYLLKFYLESCKIHEVQRIVESNFKTELQGDMMECRNIIIKHLKNCPVGIWVSTREFIDYVKIMDKNFLLDQVKYISCFSDKYREYHEPWVGWEQVEGRFIEVMLQEYLSVLGIVDTVLLESEGGGSDYDELPFFKVEYFRITPLGAFVLGMSKDYSYQEQVTECGFTVEKGCKIKVLDELSNQVHKLFFERFVNEEEHPQYCIYKLSFGAIVRALDKGITIKSIIEYIRNNSLNGIPSELIMEMLKWEKDSDKVFIKKVTVVQTDNRELMEELLKDREIRKHMVSDCTTVFEINSDSAIKVKRAIEKKEYYCKLLNIQKY